MTDYLKSKGIKQIFSLAYKPTSQGIVERMNGTVKGILRKHFIMSQSKRWVDILPQVERNLNSSYQTTIEEIPDKVHYLPEDNPTIVRLYNKYQERKEKKAIERGSKQFEFNDRVRITNRSLDPKAFQPNSNKSYRPPNYSKELYTVVASGPLYTTVESETGKQRLRLKGTEIELVDNVETITLEEYQAMGKLNPYKSHDVPLSEKLPERKNPDKPKSKSRIAAESGNIVKGKRVRKPNKRYL
jgi:hypothetical protein